jgi:hypothetical protein
MVRIVSNFGLEVRAILEQKGWSFRRATINTGIPHTTIGMMADGLVPGKDHIINWAVALKEPINKWLTLAGYDPIPENLVRESAPEYRIVRSSTGDNVCIPTDADPPQEDIDRIAAILRHGGSAAEDLKRA